MKKTKAFMFLFILLIGLAGLNNKDHLKLAIAEKIFDAPFIKGEAAVVIDEQTGDIVYAKNAHEPLPPASTTKLLTALVVLERSSIEEQVTVGEEVNLRIEGEARAGLFAGEVLSVEDLLAALLLQSGNDAARTLAVYIAEKESGSSLETAEAMNRFVQLMNERASELGASNSYFINPHGLHDPSHVSTAYDLTLIAQAVRKHDEIKKLTNLPSYATKTKFYTNRNKLLDSTSPFYDERVTGLKTGFTSDAGYCLVTSAHSAEREIITVVLNSTEQSVWSDSVALLNYSFAN